MDYPIKYVIAFDNVAAGYVMVYVPGGVVGAPEGGVVFELPGDSPVDTGWRRIKTDDEGPWIWVAP